MAALSSFQRGGGLGLHRLQGVHRNSVELLACGRRIRCLIGFSGAPQRGVSGVGYCQSRAVPVPEMVAIVAAWSGSLVSSHSTVAFSSPVIGSTRQVLLRRLKLWSVAHCPKSTTSPLRFCIKAGAKP